jgi:hypothetical protein
MPNGFAIGAYSLMLRTRDGGASWEARDRQRRRGRGRRAPRTRPTMPSPTRLDLRPTTLVLDAEADPHLNGIVRTPTALLFMVAERGAAFRSRDGGDTWERLQPALRRLDVRRAGARPGAPARLRPARQRAESRATAATTGQRSTPEPT